MTQLLCLFSRIHLMSLISPHFTLFLLDYARWRVKVCSSWTHTGCTCFRWQQLPIRSNTNRLLQLSLEMQPDIIYYIKLLFYPVKLNLKSSPSQETEVTSTPTRPVDNVVITTKGLQDRNIIILAGTTVENKGKLIPTEIFPSVQKHDIF